jgi:hypothetical protein
MEWSEQFTEAEDEIRYAGSLAQYVGQPLRLVRANDAFELRWEEDLLGRLTRPDRTMLAETRDGCWELRHRRSSVGRIEAVDPSIGAPAAVYKRSMLRPGSIITGRWPERCRFRRKLSKPEWTLRDSGGPLLALKQSADVETFELTILREPRGPADLGLLALLCCYVALLDGESRRVAASWPSGGG